MKDMDFSKFNFVEDDIKNIKLMNLEKEVDITKFSYNDFNNIFDNKIDQKDTEFFKLYFLGENENKEIKLHFIKIIENDVKLYTATDDVYEVLKEAGNENVQIGKYIKHKKFGIGKIRDIQDNRVTIYFPGYKKDKVFSIDKVQEFLCD